MDRDGWQLAGEEEAGDQELGVHLLHLVDVGGAVEGQDVEGGRLSSSTEGASTAVGEGHIAARCRRAVKCRRCGQEGHRSDACPRSPPRSDPSRLNRPAERQAPTMTSLGGEEEAKGDGLLHRLHAGDEAGDDDGGVQVLVRADRPWAQPPSSCSTRTGGRSRPGSRRSWRTTTTRTSSRRRRASGTDTWLPEIAALRGAKILGRQVVVIDAKEERSAKWVTDWVKRLGVVEGSSALSVEPMTTFRRRDLKRMTGFARGATGQKMKEEALLLLLKVSARRKGIEGQIELSKVTPTPTGAVLTIEVDQTASEGLAMNNNVLNVGSSGDNQVPGDSETSRVPPSGGRRRRT